MHNFILKIIVTILFNAAILFAFIVDAGAFITQLSICTLAFILLITAYLLYTDHKKTRINFPCI